MDQNFTNFFFFYLQTKVSVHNIWNLIAQSNSKLVDGNYAFKVELTGSDSMLVSAFSYASLGKSSHIDVCFLGQKCMYYKQRLYIMRMDFKNRS